MIRNIIFDLAGVILNLNIERDTEALVAAGLPNFSDCHKNPGLMKPLLDYLNGLMPEEEFFVAIRPFCKEGVSDEEILWAMNAVLDDVPRERLLMLKQLRKKYKVYLLSNIYDRAWEHTLNQFEKAGISTDECFDHLFLSYEMGLAKPDPRIYQAVFEQTGIKPEETAYFDDAPENIKAGAALGLDARLVEMNKLEDVIVPFLP